MKTKTRENTKQPTKKRRRTSREGAAMIIVMLSMLITTASAIFGIHATVFELRAAGFQRQAVQTEAVSEAALTATMALVDQIGIDAIENAAFRGSQPTMYNEASLATDKAGYRFYLTDFSSYSGVNAPLDQASIGPTNAYQPLFIVDFNDHYRSPLVRAGDRADGYGNFEYVHATYTARGRTQLRAGDVTGVDSRQYHETGVDSRAYGISGPIAK